MEAEGQRFSDKQDSQKLKMAIKWPFSVLIIVIGGMYCNLISSGKAITLIKKLGCSGFPTDIVATPASLGFQKSPDNDKWYKVFGSLSKNYDDAKAWCTDHGPGYELASICDAGDREAMKNMLTGGFSN